MRTMAELEPDIITSVLCSGFWTWNPDEECTVKFNEDGTGEVSLHSQPRLKELLSNPRWIARM